MRLPPALTLLCLALAACSGPPPLRYPVPDAAAPARIAVSFRSVAVAEVSLPTYAALEEIARAGPGGQVESDPDNLWADDPPRAITLALARGLSQATGATVAPEPWPFRSTPDAVLDVRVEEALAGADGRFRLEGQYFVAPEAEDRSERARLFALSVPYDVAAGYPAIAAARGRAVSDLAALIAREGLR